MSFQLYWVGPMLGAAVGALFYDKVFSTKSCKNILVSCDSRSCNSNGVEETNDEESTVGDLNKKSFKTDSTGQN